MHASLLGRCRSLIGLLLVVAAATGCDDDGSGLGPTNGGVGFLNIQPVFRAAFAAADFGLLLDNIEIQVARPDAPSEFIVDTTAFFDPDSSTVKFGWALSLRSEADTFQVTLRLLAGSQLLFAGSKLVILRDESKSDELTAEIELDFVGPGQDIANIAIAPADSVVTFGDSVRLRVVATDSASNRVEEFFVSWKTDNSTLATVNAAGLLRDRSSRRGTLEVVALTPTGISDTTIVTLIPIPTIVRALDSNADSAPVGTSVDLGFQVLAEDGLGVTGIMVSFQAPSGASIGAPLITDSAGVVHASATLGTATVPNTFVISVAGLDDLEFTVQGVAGAPSALSFEVQPSQTTAGDAISPATEVSLKDVFGNLVGGQTIALRIGSNPGGGVLAGQTSIVASEGVATFTNLSINKSGSGYTLIVSASGVDDLTSSTFDIVPGPTASVDVIPSSVSVSSIGQTMQFSAVAKDALGNVIPGATFTWSSGDVNVVTVDASGMVTATGNGSTNVTATSAGISGSGSLAVSQTVANVVLAPASVTLNSIDATAQFTAEARDANGNAIAGASFSWNSGDMNVVTVDASGLATATGNGSTNVTATSGGVAGNASVTVSQTTVTVVVTPASVTLNSIDATQQFSAEARDANGHAIAGASFTWSSGDVDVVTVDASGLATATGNGSANVTATNSGISGNASVTVSQTVATIAVTPGSVTLNAVGQTQQFGAQALDANGNAVAGVSLAWGSSDPSILTVDGSGLAAAVSNGSVIVTAAGAGQTGSATATVAQTVATVVVSPTTQSLSSIGQTAQFTAEARDANGNAIAGASFSWNSGDMNVVTVDASGLATATGNGSTNVTATSGGVAGNASVTVSQTTVTVVVTPASVTLNSIDATQQFSAEARDANGHAIAGASFTWSSGDVDVVTVDASGLATATGNGSANVTATNSGISGNASVTVSQAVASVEVTPTSVVLNFMGETAQLTAVAKDANGNPIPGATITWSSSNSAVASVDVTGLVTAVAVGTVQITASSGTVSAPATATADIDVLTPTSTTLSTAAALAVVGSPLTLTATVNPVPPAGENPTVEFFTGSTSLGTAPVSGSGTATLSVSTLSLATHSLTARLLATANFGSSVSSPVTQEMIQSFRTLAAFNAELGGATTETQDFESQAAGTTVSTVISNVLTANSTFFTLEVADSSNNLFMLGFDATTRQAGNGRYTLDVNAGVNRNALGFDLIAQDPTATPANLAVTTDIATLSFTVDNQSGDVNTPSFIGIVASIPLRRMLLVEGLVSGGSGTNEQVGLDDFVTAWVNLP
ncbi:MAG: beta strand repeat-containing protein [Gemmatimonadales bacterium]